MYDAKSLFRRILFSLIVLVPMAVHAQDAESLPRDNVELIDMEQQAAAKSAAEQALARQVMPFVTGIAFAGADPELPLNAGLLVFDESGRGVLYAGELAERAGEMRFGGSRIVAEGNWFENPANRILWLWGIKWIALSAVLGWPFVAFVLRGTVYKDDNRASKGGSLFFRWVGWIANVAVLVLMGGLYLLAIRRPAIWRGGPNVGLEHLTYTAALMAVTLALGLLGSLVAWGRGYWRIPSRIHYTISVASGLVFLWFLHRGGVLAPMIEQLRSRW